ncbi:MAG TPA: filamentous hemagglutinin family protein [Steroidobacteraceae bacterium]|nr:filamentous hemagglutinin family protein [Steroidobacteraceae bacterium]
MKTRAKVSRVATAVRVALLTSSPWLAAHAATLPIPCVSGACGPGVSGFVTAGAASVAQAGSKLTIDQSSENAILNWQSFNISADGTVQFVQPDAKAVALNEIYDSNPTQIFGALDANGRVFLINQNGIIFGAGAQVNVGGLVASTLQVAPTVASLTGSNPGYFGLLAPQSSGGTEAPAFIAATDANGNPVSGNIMVQQGATLRAADGGEILMFAANVTNLGTIHTPDGQTMLAAGNQVYLAQSQSSNLRGMLVEVQGQGTVQNGLASNSGATSPQQLVGQIIAEHGNISLAALAVNQYGRVSANTSVTENGSIYLEARNGTIDSGQDTPGNGGTLTLGQDSDTEVTLDTSDPTTTVDNVAQPKSTIQMSGATIDMVQGSVARATSGNIDVYAAHNLSTLGGYGVTGGTLTGLTGTSDGSRFYMAPGAQLDVSGASVTLPASDNVIAVPLYATELADSPIQRNGPLHGQTIYIDIRAHGTGADGSTWWGTPVANATGEIQGIARDVAERNLTGGTVSIQSQGDVILAPNSTINVSGGYIQYTGGYLDTSQLLTLWGQTVPIASADPNIPYAGVVNSTTTTDAKWGVTQTHNTTPSYYSPGYMEGKDAGTLGISAPNFILDGSVSASTIVGQYQVQPTGTVSGISQSMYRPYNEVPNGATLQVGTPGGSGSDRVAGSIEIAPGQVLPSLTNADGTAFNPLTDPLPANFTASSLAPLLLSAFGHIAIDADGKLTVPSTIALNLPAGGSFAGTASDIDMEGSINAPGGSIGLSAESDVNTTTTAEVSLTLGAQAVLTATGEWINESTVLYPAGNNTPLYTSGGNITLTTADTAGSNLTPVSADLNLAPGSLIDVSGGAELTGSGELIAGKGGSIAINAGTPASVFPYGSGGPPSPHLELGATLRGYAIYNGGSLSISAAGVCIASADCTGNDPAVAWLTPQFFDEGGFGSYKIRADQSGLTIAPSTSLQLYQENLELPSHYTVLPDAATLVGIAQIGELPLEVRQPTSLALSLQYPNNITDSSGTNPGLVITPGLPSFVFPQGDVVSTDPGGAISLTSNTLLDVEGTIRAPGGAISLALSAGVNYMNYAATHAIWLGPDAVLDASGTTEVYPNSLGELSGNVLAGGNVNIDAAFGYLEMLPGSVIDVSGASGLVDILPPASGPLSEERIASAGGNIDIFAAFGGVIDGAFRAGAGVAGGDANQPTGGALSLTVEPQGLLPGAPRADTVILSSTLSPYVVAPGSAVPEAISGQALLSASALDQAGFSIVALKSYQGGIDFSASPTLTAAQEVSLDAETFSVDPGTTASVEAPYVEFGSSSTPYGMTPTTTGPESTTTLSVPGGTGELNVSGGFIELYGTSSLSNIGTVSFDSSGDLRLRGVQGDQQSDPAGTYSGALYDNGTIELTAQQIYPTTLTQFLISADPATVSDLSNLTSGSIVINGSEGSNQDLLSAAGSLTLSAASITQGGVLRAPFGTIAMYANALTLSAGSVTSTSADGETIPFGNTQAGTTWVYPLGPQGSGYATLVYGTGAGEQAPPSQDIVLNGANINVQSGANIDVSGGGDLQAYEWIAGTGGTSDVLGSTGSYAIVPALHAEVAPYDPLFSFTSSVPQLGEAVHLSAGSGVAAGTYILLPARYALLPGAYLVTPMSGTSYQDMQPGQTSPGADGGTIVAGYLTTGGLTYGSSRWNGFDVTPASIYLNESQYTISSGNQFFSNEEASAAAAEATQAASNTAVSAMRLPEDAGVLVFDATNALSLDGTLHTAAQSGAQGAEVDIANPNIVIASDSSTVTQPGALVLTTSSLDQLGAQTLLIGGEDGDGLISTTAQNVTVLGGASLTAPQILLTAQNQISVESGASITGKGSGPAAAAYSLTGDGALLAVSSGSQISIVRSGALGAQGTLNLAAGSTLSAGKGSIYLDATSVIDTQGTMNVTGGNLAVQAPAIALGNAPVNFTGAVLGQNVFGSGSLGTLLLVLNNPQGTAAVQVYDGTAVSAQNIVIDAPGLEGYVDSGQTATLTASGTLTLGDALTAAGATSGSVAPPPTNSGALVFSASSITIGDALPGVSSTSTAAQQVDIAGFGSVALDAQGAVTAAHDITLAANSDLSIQASQVTTAAGVNATIEAGYVDSGGNFNSQGAVSLLAPASPTALSVPAALGGSLAILGSSVELGTNLDLPSGKVSLLANGAGAGEIKVDSNGSINVAGIVQQYNTTSFATPGGHVALSATGDIDLASGSAIDVSAGSGGAGGAIAISAPAGTVTAQGTIAGQGQSSSFSIDAGSFDLTAISALVNQSPGEFSGAQSYRLRGNVSGGSVDLTLASALTAHDVLLEADSGKVDIEGTVDASGSTGGNVTLAALTGITVNGAIDAHATSPGGNGGTVELDLANNPGAYLRLGATSVINVSGGGLNQTEDGSGATVSSTGAGGTVLLRVPYDQNPLQPVGGVSLVGAINGASKTVLEVYDVTPEPTDSAGNVDITAIDPAWQAYVATISNAESTTLAQLAPASSWNFVMAPGIEIDAPGNITLDTPLDLSSFNSLNWRAVDPVTGVQDIPGVLTLRAGQGVTFNASLSDAVGPIDSTTKLPSLSTQSSWSYRIVAGADSSAADPLATTGNSGDVTIGSGSSSGVVVRTGDGFIDVAASRDFILGNPTSALYTTGIDSGASTVIRTCNPRCFYHYAPDYAVGGGDINVTAGRNIVGAPSNQFVNAWLWRFGIQTPGAQAAVGWSVDTGNFSQGVGALGGGDVTIRAGNEIDDLSASVASIGVASTSGGNTLVEGGGALSVGAGGSIQGGSYYVGLGSLALAAGGSIGASPNTQLEPLIGLGDASVSVAARADLALSGIVTPTLLNLGATQAQGGFVPYDFSGYGSASTAALVSIGGDVSLDDQGSALDTVYGPSFSQSSPGIIAEGILPPVLEIAALSGSVSINRGITLFPSVQDNLQVLAQTNITIGQGAKTVQVVVPDADPRGMPTIGSPVQGTTSTALAPLSAIEIPFTSNSSDLHGASPLFGSVSAFDENPVTFVAASGDITVPDVLAGSGLWSGKPVIISAGQDVVNLNLVAQNLTPGDVTAISAGRDVVYPQGRNTDGSPGTDANAIVVSGPGTVQVTAGRNVDLGTSNGIKTVGNEENSALPSSGAGISVQAGVAASGGTAAQYAAFIKQYIDGSSDYDALLVSFVQQLTGQSDLTSASAKQTFDGMPLEEQREFLEQVFFTLLKTYGEEAVKSGNNADYAGAYAAIQELFPGANPNLANGEKDPYQGDISLYFSQIYSYAGGGISLFAPGGEVNAGLALSPAGYGLNKSPTQLGIVVAGSGNLDSFTYSDFLVNESRVFAAGGGNILVWSTEGNIDAGRGSKTSLSAAAPTVNYDTNGFPAITYFPPTSGSGIQALADIPGTTAGSVDLFAPHGVVNASEAGIVAGDLIIGATRVLGANNISVSGSELGVPTTVTGLGTQALSGSNAAAGAANSAQSSVAQNGQQEEKKAPEAEAALRWLDVFVLGFGEETCSANDIECLKRQKQTTH